MSEKRLSVAIVGSNGLPGRYGGWDQLMEHLTSMLEGQYKFYVYTSSHDAIPGLTIHNGAELNIVRLKANGYQSVMYDGISMMHAMRRYDVLLILGTSGCVFLPIVKFLSDVRIVLNPDGAEWKRGKWNKWIKHFLKYSERCGIKHSDAVIADNKIMSDYFKEEYGVDSEIIEYGGDHAGVVELSTQTSKKYSIERGAYAFKVSRIEPENNVELILQAFAKTNTQLIYVGNWVNSSFGINQRLKYANCENMILLDAIYDQQELNELRSNCGLYVHGHSVGGTNPSLVEAMHLGLSCVVFDVNYNRVTTADSARYFADEKGLLELISSFEANETSSREVGVKMASIANQRYTWTRVVSLYSKLINSA